MLCQGTNKKGGNALANDDQCGAERADRPSALRRVPGCSRGTEKGPHFRKAASIRIVFLNTTGSRRSRERPSPPRQFKQQPGAIAAAASDRSNYVHGKSKHFHSWRELLDRQHNRARRWRCHTSTDRKSRFVANLGRRSGSGDFLALRSNPKLKVTATDRKETP